MSLTPHLEYDDDGVRRVAQVLLRHTRPETRNEAETILHGRLGVYTRDGMLLRTEIDKYFGTARDRAA